MSIPAHEAVLSYPPPRGAHLSHFPPSQVSHLHPGTAMLGTAVRLSVLLGLLSFGKGQMFHMGPCPDPPVQEDFDISKV